MESPQTDAARMPGIGKRTARDAGATGRFYRSARQPAVSATGRGSHCTWMRRGVVSGFLGMSICSTPCLPVAVMPSGLALSGREKRR